MKDIISVFLLFTIFSTFGQEASYIESYNQGLSISSILAAKNVELEFKPIKKTDYPALKYEPNLTSQYGAKIGYNGVAFTFLTNTSTYRKNPQNYGKTKFSSLGLDVSTKKWWYRADYSFSKGFFIDNVGEFLKPVKQDLPPFVVSHLSLKRYSFSGMYFFNNEKYSHKSWINQLEKQKKSAGSVLMQYNAFRTVTVADTSMIPWRFGKEYVELNGLKRAKIDNIILQIGYGYTLSIKEQLSIGARLLIGPGYQARKFVNVQKEIVKTKNIGAKADIGFFVMHAGRRFNYGFLFDATTVSSRIRLLNYNATFVEARLFFGVRFPNVRLMSEKSKLAKIKWLKRWAVDAEL